MAGKKRNSGGGSAQKAKVPRTLSSRSLEEVPEHITRIMTWPFDLLVPGLVFNILTMSAAIPLGLK